MPACYCCAVCLSSLALLQVFTRFSSCLVDMEANSEFSASAACIYGLFAGQTCWSSMPHQVISQGGSPLSRPMASSRHQVLVRRTTGQLYIVPDLCALSNANSTTAMSATGTVHRPQPVSGASTLLCRTDGLNSSFLQLLT